ncbi:hypothetical protein [Pleomorphomonas sp. JP5]|uniref:hypothetical protein n=1 Tax=Pleomorphomonas sp. JP5 TaxID=2942998 RepID=UPI002043846E|nr:hypothetical protein [Pleomorphomonas sp. JP5]MCM5557230.1 hypothetical protein [Pleomorphomonas sp. JP5]
MAAWGPPIDPRPAPSDTAIFAPHQADSTPPPRGDTAVLPASQRRKPRTSHWHTYCLNERRPLSGKANRTMQISSLAAKPLLTSLFATGASSSRAHGIAEEITKANAIGDLKGANNNVSRPSSLLSDLMQASLAGLQEQSSSTTAGSGRTSINGLSVITSGHSLDEQEGQSLLRTAYNTESTDTINSLSDQIASLKDMSGDKASVIPGSGYEAQLQDTDVGMTETSVTALGPRKDGAYSAYMSDDFFYIAGGWSNGDPIKDIKTPGTDEADADARLRLERLMNTVDAERKLKAQYGDDIKLVYSHTDNAYIMLTPDDARYSEMKSTESGVKDVFEEIRRGFVNKDAVADILKKYGYEI